MRYVLLALAIFALVFVWYEGRAMRQVLLTLVIFALVICLYEGMTALLHLGKPWLWLSLAAAGTAGANLLTWYGIVRPERVRRKRLESGSCVHCGYDLRGCVGDLCPECGHPA